MAAGTAATIMELSAEIKKSMGSFTLDIRFRTEAKRLSILGASGSGKSMTLKSIAGIVTPDEGVIRAGGRALYDSAHGINVRTQDRSVGYLFQNYALFPTMSVEKNIGIGVRGSRAVRNERVREMIRRFHLEGLEDRLPSQLSGGQQQRTAIARIMAYSPEIILLDEPFSALDIYLKDQMQQELQYQLRDYEGTVILVTHSRDEAYRFSEDLMIVDEGRIAAQGKTKDVFSKPGTVAAAKISGCKNISTARRIDDHTFAAEQWGTTLRTSFILPQDFNAVGYRAHEFLPVWGERKENCIPFLLESSAELQFEKNYYVRPDRESYTREDILTWFVQRDKWPVLSEKGMPDYLQFQEKDLLFLQAGSKA